VVAASPREELSGQTKPNRRQSPGQRRWRWGRGQFPSTIFQCREMRRGRQHFAPGGATPPTPPSEAVRAAGATYIWGYWGISRFWGLSK
jgi:hypothetical protein